MQSVVVCLFIGYLLGSIPFGYIVSRCRGIDIRQHGSGNIGATNVFRTLGRKWGVLVFVLDALKGVLAVRLGMALPFLTERLAHGAGVAAVTGNLQLGMWAGLGCFLGHCFPVWLGFKGGKGVATGAGVLIGMMPLAAVIGLTIWGIAFKLTRYVSLASLIAAVSLPLIVWLLESRTGPLFWFAVVISALAIWRHRTNIQRLLAGTESRFERKK